MVLAGAVLLVGFGNRLRGHDLPSVTTAGGLQLLISDKNSDPTLRIVLPGHPRSDRAIEVIFPEHVTAKRRGTTEAEHLYQWRPGQLLDRCELYTGSGQRVEQPCTDRPARDPQSALPPGGEAILEVKILVLRGSLDDALQRARQQRGTLK